MIFKFKKNCHRETEREIGHNGDESTQDMTIADIPVYSFTMIDIRGARMNSY